MLPSWKHTTCMPGAVCDGVCNTSPPWGGFPSSISRQPRECQSRTVRLRKALGEMIPTRAFLAPALFQLRWRYRAWKIGPGGAGVMYTVVRGILDTFTGFDVDHRVYPSQHVGRLGSAWSARSSCARCAMIFNSWNKPRLWTNTPRLSLFATKPRIILVSAHEFMFHSVPWYKNNLYEMLICKLSLYSGTY